MSPTIICGIDDSTHARAAARLTFALAERLSLRPVLVHAVSGAVPPLMPVMPHRVPLERGELVLAAREAGERLLEEILAEAGGSDACGRIEAGRPAERVVAAAEDEDAALVVVGTHGDGVGRATLLGSVSLSTVRDARCPVVVVPPRAAVAEDTPLAGEGVLCGIGSADDKRCALLAARLAGDLGLPLTLAHVLPAEYGGTGAPLPPGTSSGRERREAEGRAVLRAVTEAVPGGHDLRMCTGEPAEELDALAVRERAAMVVVGTRGYGPLRSALLGSVSRELACHGSRPLMVCPARARRKD